MRAERRERAAQLGLLLVGKTQCRLLQRDFHAQLEAVLAAREPAEATKLGFCGRESLLCSFAPAVEVLSPAHEPPRISLAEGLLERERLAGRARENATSALGESTLPGLPPMRLALRRELREVQTCFRASSRAGDVAPLA